MLYSAGIDSKLTNESLQSVHMYTFYHMYIEQSVIFFNIVHYIRRKFFCYIDVMGTCNVIYYAC